MQTQKDSMEHFLSLSAVLTGFDLPELLGTGLAEEYFQQIVTAVGEDISRELWGLGQRVRKNRDVKAAIERDLMASPKYGPVARNLIHLWYWGTWLELSPAWRYLYGSNPQQESTRFTSPAAYREGLVWKVLKAHPQGAKQPGFGSWSLNPDTEFHLKEDR